jgi:hypothetical protein
VRPDVRRGKQDAGPGVERQIAELETVFKRLSAVVTGRDDVRMAVDEAGLHL